MDSARDAIGAWLYRRSDWRLCEEEPGILEFIDQSVAELNENLQKEIAKSASTNTAEAEKASAEVKRVAQMIEQKAQVMGPRAAKKTMLAKQVLQEMNSTGRVSKKTQLAVDDAARAAMDV